MLISVNEGRAGSVPFCWNVRRWVWCSSLYVIVVDVNPSLSTVSVGS